MEKKATAFSSIAWAFATILNASPAHARVAVLQADLTPNQSDATHVMISGDHEPYVFTICGYTFTYLQRMTIEGGPSTEAFVESVYGPGRETLHPVGLSCDGYSIYEVGSCSC